MHGVVEVKFLFRFCRVARVVLRGVAWRGEFRGTEEENVMKGIRVTDKAMRNNETCASPVLTLFRCTYGIIYVHE